MKSFDDVWNESLSPPCVCISVPDPLAKVVDVRRAAAVVKVLREVGQVAVFTNGCLDLLHAGHLATLKAARQLGNLLIVAVNSDASVRTIKGLDRPIQCQHVRAAQLAALGCVDLIVLMADLTPHRLLVTIRPHILAKGGTTGGIVGADLIAALGGRAVRIDCLVPGVSTTALLISRANSTRNCERRPWRRN
jgi:rfaE bifunctional protein nucleotidyltransferase chain/domain